jgi:thiazole synthase ThiGH ThiG subunit
MELGATAVLMNTAIAGAKDAVKMARASPRCRGRDSIPGSIAKRYATASSQSRASSG